MPYDFLDTLATPAVVAAQQANGVREMWEHPRGRTSDRFTANEAAFIGARDSFYMATVSENGWPYMQHRGGPAGFLKMLDDKTLGFADFRGNRQYISVGNLAADNRAALFLMDYPHRTRLKVLAHVEMRDLADDRELMAKLVPQSYRARPERALLLHLHAFAWNCPQHITPRYTEAEVQAAVQPMRDRLAALEAENAGLRERLAAG